MKFYIFKQIKDSLGEFESPRLFAFTNNKELADEFKETRNMKLFICREKDIDKDMYKYYRDTYNGYDLVKATYLTQPKDSPFRQNVSIVSRSCEEFKVITQLESTVLQEIAKHTDEDADALNDKILKSLNDMYYFELLHFYCSRESGFLSGYNTLSGLELVDIEVDQLGVFSHFYGNTMKV